jgi:hypothetical protein
MSGAIPPISYMPSGCAPELDGKKWIICTKKSTCISPLKLTKRTLLNKVRVTKQTVCYLTNCTLLSTLHVT